MQLQTITSRGKIDCRKTLSSLFLIIFHLFSRTVKYKVEIHIWNIFIAHYFSILFKYSCLISSRWHWTRFSHYPNKTQNIRQSHPVLDIPREIMSIYIDDHKSKIIKWGTLRCILFFFNNVINCNLENVISFKCKSKSGTRWILHYVILFLVVYII